MSNTDDNILWSTSRSSSREPNLRPLLTSSSLAFTLGTAAMDQPDGPDSPLDSAEENSIKLAPIKTGRIRPVLYACLVAVLGSFSVGFVLGFSSPALPDLDRNSGANTNMNKSVYHSMFNALMPVGAVFGGLVGGWMVDHFGRQLSFMLSSIPMVAGWVMILVTHATDGPLFRPLLFFGRFFTGIGVGFFSLNVPLYISEIAPGKLRGLFGVMNQLSLTIGVFAVQAFGIGLEYEWLSVIALLVIAVFAPLVTTLVETPRWLISRGRNLQANKVLLWLRGKSYSVNIEQSEIEEQLASEDKLTFLQSLTEFKSRAVYHPTILALILMIFQQFSGINAVVFNAEKIFEQSKVSNAATVSSLAVGGVQVIATFVGFLLTDVLGRKILLIIGGAIMTLSMVSMGAYGYLTNEPYCNPDASNNTTGCVDHLQPLAITSIMFYIVGFSIGWGALPWLLSSEIIPMRVRGVGMGVATLTNYGCAAIVTGAFEGYQNAVHPWGTFWSFAVMCLLSIIFVAVFIPETKGKTLEDIEKYFLHRHRKDYTPL